MSKIILQRKNHSFYDLLVIIYILALTLFLFFSQADYTFASRLMAWCVFVVGSFPAIYYVSKKRKHVPIIELIMLVYVNAFAIPLFFQDRQKIFVKVLYPASEPVVQTLLLVLIAIASLWWGYKLAPAFLKVVNFPRFRLNCSPDRLFYYASFLCLLSIGIGGIRLGSLQGLLRIITGPELGVALLAILYYKGLLSLGKKYIAIILMAIMVLIGVTSGMVEAMLLPVLIWYFARWLVTRKFEYATILLGVFLLVLLQPVKLQYRNIVWNQQVQIGSIEKLSIFSGLFYKYWLVSEQKTKIVESTYSRSSLLLQTAHVIDWTPNIVEYKNGETLSYMFVTLIPRFIWPNKPIAQQANIDYAIDYGVSTAEGIKRTMFGVGHLSEVFMNFGSFGILPIYLLLGFLYYLPLYLLSIPKGIIMIFNHPHSNEYIASMALLLAIICRFLFIGSTVGDTFGGFIQLIIIQGGLLYLLTGKKKV